MDRRPTRCLLLASAALAVAPAGAGAAPVYVLTGHGFGHGIGMSQYGAQGMAELGANAATILGHYYPGTAEAAAPAVRIRVLLATVRRLAVSVPAGTTALQDEAVPVPVVGALTAATAAGRVTLTDPAGVTVAQGATLRLQAPAPVVVGTHPYRGDLVLRADGTTVQTVNEPSLDDYVRGVVARESPSYWNPAALQAQAVAARSYALAVRKPSGDFDVYPDQRSQVYGGVDAETDATDAAVEATADTVLTFDGRVAATYFYSSSGGRTAARQDVWGGAPVDYLRSVADPTDRISPWFTWVPRTYTAVELGRLLRLRAVTAIRVWTNPSLRVASVDVTARGGTVRSFSGTDLRTRLGLRSSWFRLRKVDLQAAVRRHGRVRIRAVVDPPAPTTLLGRAPGGPWVPLATARPTADGRLALAAPARGAGQFALRVGGVTGAVVRAR